MSNSKFYVLVAGSRSFANYDLMVAKLDALLSRQIVDHRSICIVSGGARGADKLAERYARERGFELRIFPADWNKFGKSAGYRRNEQMHQFIAQFEHRGCVCFWDGESRGTAHNFKLAEQFKTPLRVVRFEAGSKKPARIFERLSETGNAMEKTYTFETFANDGHKSVCVTVRGYCDNSDCNAPGESYIISQRCVSREKAREIYKDCLNAGFKKPWYDKMDWSTTASK